MAAARRRFGHLAWDLAAHKDNAQCRCYISEKENSLSVDWHDLATREDWLWLNPPFDNIAPWAEKCTFESARGAKILFLVPASVGSLWYHDHVHNKAMVYALTGRMSFDGVAPYPKDCILCAYGYGAAGFTTWKWREQQ